MTQKETPVDVYYSDEKPPENLEECRRLHFHYERSSFLDHVWRPLAELSSGQSSSVPETREIVTSYGQIEINKE